MPGAARRMYPARTSRRWLGTSASAGSSRSVRRNRDDIRNNTVNLPWSRIQATGAPGPPAVAFPPRAPPAARARVIAAIPRSAGAAPAMATVLPLGAEAINVGAHTATTPTQRGSPITCSQAKRRTSPAGTHELVVPPAVVPQRAPRPVVLEAVRLEGDPAVAGHRDRRTPRAGDERARAAAGRTR